MVHKKFSHAILIEDGKVLLGKKKRGYSEGVISVYGGKLGESETFEEALIREFEEESTLEVVESEKVASLYYAGPEDYFSEHQIYLVTKYRGELKETEEMIPCWCDFLEVPYSEMWEDSIHWLPEVLQGKKVSVSFNLNKLNRVENFKLESLGTYK